jgi:hypothetical protein
VTGQSVQALAHDATSSNKLWPRRLGHLHYKELLDLQNMACGMPSISFSKNEICKGCMLGKNIKKAFPSSDSRAQGILDLVHSDVCGPMSSPSLSGCLYYVIFIDDYSKNVGSISLKIKVTYLINSKSIKPLLKSRQGNTSKPLEQTMEESLNLSSLRISARKHKSREEKQDNL